jgi:ATP-dependent helicase/nuclease subunit B
MKCGAGSPAPLDSGEDRRQEEGFGYCAAIYEFLHTLGRAPAPRKQIEEFRRSGPVQFWPMNTPDNWNILMDVFDQTVEVLGDETMGLEGFADVLRNRPGRVPGRADSPVASRPGLVGNVQRVEKVMRLKALYILGSMTGFFPAAAALEEGILSIRTGRRLKRPGWSLPEIPAAKSLTSSTWFTEL